MNEEAIFAAALERATPEERQAFVKQACANNANLQALVEGLLKAHDNPDSFFEAPAPSLVPTVDEPIAERPGTVIGPYKLLEQIGEGGFGVVFMAEQQQPIRRKVALKVIKPGMDTRQVIARFEAERQALALMDHPNIAKVLDAGTTEPVVSGQWPVAREEKQDSEALATSHLPLATAGRPYFVMDLVKGIPITDYCDQNQVPIRERLELFLHVCQAVQHAHQKGIIHRDIKPTNVMVTLQDGAPLAKIIDFGIAKAMGQQLTDKTLFTNFAQLIGTPLYMSPEQAALSNVDVDTRSDIYSLGVLLYELLTGTTPFDKERLKEAGYDEIRRIIREEEPPKPSTRISTLGKSSPHAPRAEIGTRSVPTTIASSLETIATQRKSDPTRLSQLCRGELDWIVMKALDKDRNRRYDTANGLARDIECYLHDEPVQACPPSAIYRFRKFARRNRTALAIASVVTAALMLLVVGLSTGVVLLGRANQRIEQQRGLAERQRDLAQENFQKALQVVDEYFTQVSESTLLKSDVQGLQPLRKQLLQTALKYYQDFAQQHRDDAALQAELARAYFRVARISEELGAKPDALQAYREARDLWEKLRQEDPANPTYPHELAQCYGRLGSLQSRSADEGENALASLQQACALAEAVAASYPDQHAYQKTLARAYHQLGLWYREHESPQALLSLGKALKVWEQLAQDEPELELQVAMLSKDLGYYHAVRGDPKDALAFHGRARDIVEKWAERKPKDFEIRRLLRYVYKNLGWVHDERTRQYKQALDYYAKVLKLDEELATENPAVFEFQWWWAGDLWQTGDLVYKRTRDYAKAAALAREGLQRYERLDREHPHDPEIQKGLCWTYLLHSRAQAKTGHPDEAIRSQKLVQTLLDQLLRDRAATAAIPPPVFAEDYMDLGEAQNETGQTTEALRSYQRAVELYRKILNDSPGHHLALGSLAGTYLAQGVLQRRGGQLAEARHSLQEARALLSKLPSLDARDHWNQACVCAQLSLLVGAGKPDLPPPGQAEKRTLEEEAMAALCRALADGSTDLEGLKTDPDLEPLRSRKDFQELLANLEKKQ